MMVSMVFVDRNLDESSSMVRKSAMPRLITRKAD
jgi:hypothetical protein